MSFVERFHAALIATDPRPLVSEVRGGRVVPVPRPELATRVARIRGGLRAAALSPGDRVVVVAPNSADWVALDLALLFEGAVSVPMYARQTPHEIAANVGDCGPRLVVADRALGDALLALGCDVPVVGLDELLAAVPVVAPPAPRRPQDLVTLVYTSGTSGAAKGARITRGNVDGMLATTAAALSELMGDEDGHDVVFHYLPLCFMGSRVVLWTTLLRETGITLSTDLDRLVDELGVAAPHYLLNVPLVLERIRAGVEASIAGKGFVARWLWARAKEAWARHLEGRPLGAVDRFALQQAEQRIFATVRARFGPNLRFLICGSAALNPETQRWFDLIGVPVYQVYGLTETTGIVTMDRPEDALPGWVGVPIPGCEVRLGEGDELQVRGGNVFDGYWNRPEATAAAFVDGWYRTGDRAELAADGRLAIQGRLKELLVPSTGHNVAPEPLEQQLVEAIPGAEQVVLVGHGRPYLAALVTGAPREADLKAGFEQVNATLPHYRQVRRWRVLGPALTHEDGLLTANGKLRRHEVERRFHEQIEALYR